MTNLSFEQAKAIINKLTPEQKTRKHELHMEMTRLLREKPLGWKETSDKVSAEIKAILGARQ